MRRTLLLAAVAAVALSVAACSDSNNTSSGATTTTTAGPTVTTTTVSADEAAAWMDKVCGELLELDELKAPPPANLAEGGPQQALDRIETYFAENLEVVNQSINDLTQLGEPPFRGGAQIQNAVVRGLTVLRDTYQVVKDKFAAIDPNNPQQAQARIQEAMASFEQGEAEWDKAFESVQTFKDMEQAAEAAPNCQKLDGPNSTTGGTATPTTTTT